MGRRNTTPPPPPPTILDRVEQAALQAIDERNQLTEGLESLKIERRSVMDSYDRAIIETEEKLRKTTALADGLSALFESEDVR